MMNLHGVTIPMLRLFEDPKRSPSEIRNDTDNRDRIDHGKKIKIIVVDDETLIAETVAEILNQAGFEATPVSNGSDAIELAKTWLPDIILSDVVMPGLNGIETGIKIRQIAPSCKIILFSGQAATVDLLEEARRHGQSFDILPKPIKPERLISVIRSGFLS
jgi:CheY-like chemotaxis protein